METTLHRQLKELYCRDTTRHEVWVGEYRVDAVVDGALIEIQYGSLGALRGKLRGLLDEFPVIVVKPLAAQKTIIRRKKKNGPIASTRTSPRHETLLHLFDDLVHFVEIFPHPHLTLDILLTDQEEHRIAKRPRRWRGKDYSVEDRLLRSVTSRYSLRTLDDLRALLPPDLSDPFTTAEIARMADIPRWLAQKMAYCLRKIGAIQCDGKRRNALLYRRVSADRAAA